MSAENQAAGFSERARRGESVVESDYAWARLAAALALSTIGGIGMWAIVVALPAIQADFGIARADISLAYTANMIGFGLGGVVAGWITDRHGIATTVGLGAVVIGAGFVSAGFAPDIGWFALAHGALIGIGCAVTFAPMIADISHWFDRNRGIAVAICASGNYLAGVVWPPAVQYFIREAGWRPTYIGIGIVCLATMLPFALALRRRPPVETDAAANSSDGHARAALGLSPTALQGLLIVAGVACCVAMSMPQVHIVAYCADLGYGVARGAEMLSLMLGFGIVSRLVSGWISDKIGGLRTLLLGSLLQGTALVFYLFFDGLVSLYVVSALFGLFQGGIVPSYAIIVREFFPSREAGARVGTVVMATIAGMALGGWMSGAIFDLTGSYAAAFMNGLAWNLLNGAVVLWLTVRILRRAVRA